MSATAQGQGKPGEELITLNLQRAHQIDEQDTNDAIKGENGAAGKVASGLAVSGDAIHGSDGAVDFIDRNEIWHGRFLVIFSYISMV